MRHLNLTSLILLGVCTSAEADSEAWRVLNFPSDPLDRTAIGNYSIVFGCGREITDMAGQVYTSQCYDLGKGIFVVHQPGDDTCDLFFLGRSSLPEVLVIQSLPSCSEKSLFQDVGMLKRDPHRVLKSNYGIDVTKLQ